MAKRKDPTEQVRIYTETAKDIRNVCEALGFDFADYVRDRLRPSLTRDLALAAKKTAERAEELADKKKNGHKSNGH